MGLSGFKQRYDLIICEGMRSGEKVLMNFLISGASGLIGKELTKFFVKKGHQVIPLQRTSSSTQAYWDINNGTLQIEEDLKIDVIIHLAGESIAEGRWNKEKKERIKNSRVNGTKLLAEYFSKAKYQPGLFISGSAIGFYGNRGDEKLFENSKKGNGFLADVCHQWETATAKVSQVGIRVANIRLGMVLSSKGGALKKMLFPFKIGFGGIIGNGQQYISWIEIQDVVGAINHIIENTDIKGPVNIVSPSPVTNYNFTKTLGNILKRPTILPLPAFWTKILLGEMAQELLLSSTRVIPEKLQKAGYIFKNPTLKNALQNHIT